MQTIQMRVVGVGSILMHNPASMYKPADPGTMQRGGKKIPTPYDEAKASLFTLPNGQLYIKSDCFREACIIASSDIKDPTRKGRATMTRRFAASVFLSKESFPLTRTDGAPITSKDGDWEIDTRRVVVQRNGIMRSRAKITDWSCMVEFEYDEDTMDPALICAVVRQSGKYPGVLDYRVGKKGPFGRFDVAEVTNGDAATNGDAVPKKIESKRRAR